MTGAELVLAMENTKNDAERAALWPRIRAVLLSAARSGEDARDAARWRKHMEAMRDEMSCLLIRMFEGTAEDYEAAIDAAMGPPMPDPLTPDDVEAILRGGGSAESKLQRAAAIALEKRAMGKDLLTEEECSQILRGLGTAFEMFQKAARLGAELARAQRPFTGDDADVQAHKAVTAGKLAAAIRRGEGGNDGT